MVVVAASGTSGAGRVRPADLLASEVMGALSAYKAGGAHQHTPEMEQNLGAAAGEPVTLSFTPMLAPMPRGILATSTARLTAGTRPPTRVRDAVHAAYDDEPFVHLLPEGQLAEHGRHARAATACTCRSRPTGTAGGWSS